MIEHLTWSNPTRDELRLLKNVMFLKAVRLLLSAAAVFAVMMICTFLLNLGGPDIDTRLMMAPVFAVLIRYDFRGDTSMLELVKCRKNKR